MPDSWTTIRTAWPKSPGLQVATVLLVITLGLASWAIWAVSAAAATARWPATMGSIAKVEFQQTPLSLAKYTATVRYMYSPPDDPLVYTGRAGSRLGPLAYMNDAEKVSAERRYQFGNRVSVRYNPKDPRMAVLEAGVRPVQPFTSPVIRWAMVFGIGGLLLLSAELRRLGLFS